jgi:hypothetical protein
LKAEACAWSFHPIFHPEFRLRIPVPQGNRILIL